MVRVTNVYAICAFAAIGGFFMSISTSFDTITDNWETGGGLFGFDISSMSGVLGTNAYKNYFGHPIGSRVCTTALI